MRWFKHEADARNSLKLRKVRRKYGADGYAIYWFCLEAIAYDVDKDNLTFQLKEDAETIGFELSIQEKRVEEIMRYMVEIGLFESSRNTITCLKLAERLDKTMTNSPKMRKWLETKSVMTSDDSVMALGDIPRHSATSGELEVEENRIDNNTITPDGDITPPPEKPRKPKVPSIDYLAIQEIWNTHMTKASKVTAITDKRKRAIKKLFDVFQLDLAKFENYVNYVNSNPKCQWMFEEQDRGNGQVWQKKGFDYITSEACFLRVKEEY